MGHAIGIDLGTCNSAAAVALGRNRIAMVESRYGRTLYGKSFPSYVMFDRCGRKQLIGQRAKEEMRLNPELVVWGVKRLVGLSYRTALLSGELKRFQYAVEEGLGGGISIRVGDERFSPSHILELILREIKEDAEDPRVNPLLGGRVDRAVISIPAYFKAIRTAPIVEAARQAGFDTVDTIAEPTAAAIHRSVQVDEDANILAFDIGAGTLDVTVMMVVREGGELVPGELCTSGHEALGGIDMDDLLRAHVVDRFDLRGIEADPGAAALLLDEVEKAKIRLSTREVTSLDLPGGRSAELRRGEMEEVLRPLLDRFRGPIHVAMLESGLGPEALDHVLFIGGPTQMPCVRQVVEDEIRRLGISPALEERMRAPGGGGSSSDPMEGVARGAALKAGNIVEPVGKVIAEGYGLMYGPTPGADGYYAPIIRENSHYPISGRGVAWHMDPSALEVPVPLVAKRPDVDRSGDGRIVYKYEVLGNYTLGITPGPSCAAIDIELKVTDDKRIVARLTHTRTGQQVRFAGLDTMRGEEIELQEHTPPAAWTEEDVAKLNETLRDKQGRWTEIHLEHHLHVARQAIDGIADRESGRIGPAVDALEKAVARAVVPGRGNPNVDCPTISNRTKELLDTLRQPDVKRLSDEEFRGYMEQLIRIAELK
jgi:molecular chaperone DnaK (HSP70)